jgi:DNA-binding NarL/FixJ family response regulator
MESISWHGLQSASIWLFEGLLHRIPLCVLSVHPELALIAEEILELVRSRSSPGVLILDRDHRVLYANREALTLLKSTGEIPPEMRALCDEVQSNEGTREPAAASTGHCALLWREGESPCSMRAILIGAQGSERPATHVMVLIENVTEQRGLNLKKAKTQYGLSDREIEVVALIAQGLPNKEIGARLFLSEHTIKDHIKNIMKKMSASSRSEIIYLLK